MSICLFGTCRLNRIRENNNLNNLTTYTHSTKEVIQLIKFLNGEIIIPDIYAKLCFRTGIVNNQSIIFDKNLHQIKFLNSKICIVEICSNKKYIHNNYYLHHLCVDKRFKSNNKNTPDEILKEHIVEKQSDDEIENDILEIQKMVSTKKLIIVSHYDCNISSRNHLISLLDNICRKYKIHFINPKTVLSDYVQNNVMKSDLGHYTEFGITKFTEYVNDYIKNSL